MLISRKKNKIYFLLSFLALSVACNEVKKETYVARVGDKLLTEEMLKSELSKKGGKNFREEFIREWIEKELLFQSAVDNGITTEDEYSNLVDKAKVDIAGAILMANLLDDSLSNISENELEDFFVKNISEFKLPANKYLYNVVSFNSRNDAAKFRRELKHSKWELVLNKFSNNNALLYQKVNELSFGYNIYPPKMLSIIKRMKENKYSRIVETSNGIFTVAELIKVYKKNDVPEFEEIKTEIKEKYLARKRKKIYNDYIEQLYIKYSSEIER